VAATKNLTGRQFGILVALAHRRDKGRTKWLCQCRCGKQKEIREDTLLAGKVKSCGCLSKQLMRVQKEKQNSLVNQRFGKLLVLWKAKDVKDNRRSMMWECRCDCGKLTIKSGYALRSGRNKSCGCLRGIKVNGN
jgi:hypothetical protein